MEWHKVNALVIIVIIVIVVIVIVVIIKLFNTKVSLLWFIISINLESI